MEQVYMVSPWRGDTPTNLKYGMNCMRDCLDKGEAPMASHLLYTQCLDDWKDGERELGVKAGQVWLGHAQKCAVYADYGISEGMQDDINEATNRGIPVEYRYLYIRGF